jgi:hypothetical protein
MSNRKLPSPTADSPLQIIGISLLLFGLFLAIGSIAKQQDPSCTPIYTDECALNAMPLL